MKKFYLTVYLLMLIGYSSALAQEANFEGTAGGGFDAYARAIGRHMGKHLPGKPTIIVDNMPGAGSLIIDRFTSNGNRTRR